MPLIPMRTTTESVGRFGHLPEGAVIWTEEPDAAERESLGVAERIDAAEAGEEPAVAGVVTDPPKRAVTVAPVPRRAAPVPRSTVSVPPVRRPVVPDPLRPPAPLVPSEPPTAPVAPVMGPPVAPQP